MARRREKRGFGSIRRLASGNYQARYLAQSGERVTAPTTFVARMDAEAWLLAERRVVEDAGSWRSPKARLVDAKLRKELETWARDSVPSSAPGKITQSERDALKPIGDAYGCHSCGAPTSGTKSGNWVGDHLPPSRMAGGGPQVLYPQCQTCSNAQGLWIINLLRRGLL